MAFYDGWGQKLQKTGQDALDKTKKTAEVLKINTEISNLEKEMQEAFAAIGKMHFESHPEGEEGMVSYYEKIAECTSKIEEDQDKVTMLKGGTRCKKCGKVIAVDAAFCQYCGAGTAEDVKNSAHGSKEAQAETQEEDVHAEANDVLKCLNCGEVVEEGKSFCGNCGHKL